MRPTLTRRSFMVGCSSAIAAMAGARLQLVALANPMQPTNQEILVVIFLRGGIDGLTLVSPRNGPDRAVYQQSRPNVIVPNSGPDASLALGTMGGVVELGLHPAAAPLMGLYQDGRLAVIHAAGLTSDTRSHFDAMAYMERGTPGNKSTTTGWLARHLATADNLPANVIMPALAAETLPPISLLGESRTIATEDPDDFAFYGHWAHRDQQRVALRQMYQSSAEWLHLAGQQTLDAMDIIESRVPDNYVPGNGAVYPSNGFGRELEVIAQIIKAQVGLQVATVDLGGWDTHEYQGEDGGGYFSDQVQTLAEGLLALYTDLDGSGSQAYAGRLTMVVMSEFGRSLRENNSRGTDHGHGNVMMVLGGNVNGGLHGTWPGLGAGQLYDNRDLHITTDYRRVLSEILIRRMGNPRLGQIFPGYAGYAPLGVVQGTDLPPDYGVPAGHQIFVPSLVR